MIDYFDVHNVWHVELCHWYESCLETECNEVPLGELIGNYGYEGMTPRNCAVTG